jgi:hypothetical protein
MSGKESILERKEANNGKEIIANPTDHDPIIHHSDVFLKLIEETLIKELNETATAMGAGAVEGGASPFAAVVRRRPAKKIEEKEELDEEIDEETQITEDEDEVISEVLNYLLQMSGEQ